MMLNRIRTTVLAAIAIALAGALAVAAQDDADNAVLRAIDEARFLEATYVSQVMQIVAIRPGDDVQEAAVRISYGTIEEEPFRLRLDYLAPEESVGQSFLILEDESVMLCTPGLEMPLTISGGASVFGDSTVSTTAGIQFEDEYEIVARTEETLDELPVLRVDVSGLVEGLAYPTATIWVDAETLLPLQLELYALSGDPLSRISYDEYAELDGDQYLVKQTIESLLFDDFTTVLTIIEISTEPLAEGLLNPETFCRPEVP